MSQNPPQPSLGNLPLAPLRVATWNLNNFSASEPERAGQIADTIVRDLKNPHIIALQEIKGDLAPDADPNDVFPKRGTSAEKNAQFLIDAIKNAGGVQYRYCDVPPTDGEDGGIKNGNIRCGYLYRPDRVELAKNNIGKPNPFIEADVKADILFRKTRKPCTASFIDKKTGEIYNVMNVHLRTRKRPYTKPIRPDDKDENLSPSEIFRINFERNYKRYGQVALVAEICKEILDYRMNPEREHVLICGDFNKGIEILDPLRHRDFKTPGDNLPPSRIYSTGQQESIDHIVASPEIAARMGSIQRPHSDASNHEPTIISFKVPMLAKQADLARAA